MKRSVFFKTFSGYLLITLLLSVLILLFTFATIKDHYIQTLTNDLKNLATTLKLKVTPLLKENQFDKLDTLVKELGAEIGTRITIIAPDGMVLADSEKDPKSMENHSRRLEIIQALEGKTGNSIRFSRTVKEEMLYVAIPINEEDAILGVLRISLFLSEINGLLNNLKIKILQIVIIIIAVSLFVAVIFSKSLSKPISELVNASHRVASGDFDVMILSKRKDELGELADSFNYMVTRIKKLVTELSLEKEALNTIITSIHEGIVVLDKKGKILLSNDSFGKIVNNTAVKGKFYWELIRSHELGKLIENIGRENAVASEEIEINKRNFICSAAFLSSAEQIVLTLHDITEILQVTKMKKDFVANVSHELRTPLTAIKGFVETLEQEKNVKTKHYLDIIKRHTDRLINIVQDLQLLSELEEKEKLELENVHLQKLVNNIFKMFKQRLTEKNLYLKLNIADNLPLIKADSFKLEQMFINLIDNAFKYTEKGGITITVGQINSSIKIEIEDTGIGIPGEHLSRIFERFYVVDKSRSRKMGGTGLGLAIVKHIVQVHKGGIKIESKVNKGSKFTIILPG
jgi:two-component system phosphate regulon sensor histidine kinase PhoR